MGRLLVPCLLLWLRVSFLPVSLETRIVPVIMSRSEGIFSSPVSSLVSQTRGNRKKLNFQNYHFILSIISAVSVDLRHSVAASKRLELGGLAKASLPRAGPATLLLCRWLTIRPQPQQPKGCVEEVDGRRAVCDESGLQAQGLKEFHLQGGSIKSGKKTLQTRSISAVSLGRWPSEQAS